MYKLLVNTDSFFYIFTSHSNLSHSRSFVWKNRNLCLWRTFSKYFGVVLLFWCQQPWYCFPRHCVFKFQLHQMCHTTRVVCAECPRRSLQQWCWSTAKQSIHFGTLVYFRSTCKSIFHHTLMQHFLGFIFFLFHLLNISVNFDFQRYYSPLINIVVCLYFSPYLR